MPIQTSGLTRVHHVSPEQYRKAAVAWRGQLKLHGAYTHDCGKRLLSKPLGMAVTIFMDRFCAPPLIDVPDDGGGAK